MQQTFATSAPEEERTSKLLSRNLALTQQAYVRFRQQLLLPRHAKLHAERLPPGGRDIELQAALIEQLVSGRAALTAAFVSITILR
jgi:hypothetical protein